MKIVSDSDIELAMARGRSIEQNHVLATSVRYDARTRKIKVKLNNGSEFAFPSDLIEGLNAAQDDDLRMVEVLGIGHGLRWPTLDIDLSVQGLLNGVFGTRSWMAKRGGMASSPAKAAASRENGRKGGRPRKST